MNKEQPRLTEDQYKSTYEVSHPFSPWESISDEARAFYRKRYEERAPYVQYSYEAKSIDALVALLARYRNGPQFNHNTCTVEDSDARGTLGTGMDDNRCGICKAADLLLSRYRKLDLGIISKGELR